jgi:hypothetical protein
MHEHSNNDYENYLLLEKHHEMGSKRVAVAVGRFNPPTKGHYHVFDQLKSFIRKNPNLKLESTPVVLIISGKNTRHDKEKNPLSSRDVISFIKASGLANGVICATGTNVMEGFNALRKYGFEPIAVAGGEERVGAYIELLSKYFRGPSGEKIKRYKIELNREKSAISDSKEDKKRLLDRMKGGYEPDIDEISASLAKLAVELGYEDVFQKIVGLESKPELAKSMFKKLKEALQDENDI